METLLVTIAQLISMTCLILTIAVYLYVKQLRNVLGKCIISSLFCMFFYNLTTFHIYFEIKNYTIKFAISYIYFFFVTAYNLWLSVISCYMWKMLTKLGIEESSHQFLKYSAFVWLTSFFYPVFLGLIYPLLVFAFGEELLPTVLSLFPLPIIYIFNAIMFILTAIHMVKVKRELNSFKERDETTTTCFNLDTQT
ncbi:probable G-protein coupled receptor Mth-like 12 [Drosophila rhopaloa]|uniref:Uncharacterized protein n=1 Tax=Drosophila rhopaloa TaxID=1041015 RepID=A0ABM5GX04_DRORH|nr:probable G-protein coupled receptor Mth-like 12 [Drosophila rhopaloa]